MTVKITVKCRENMKNFQNNFFFFFRSVDLNAIRWADTPDNLKIDNENVGIFHVGSRK